MENFTHNNGRDLFACLRDSSLDPARRRRIRDEAIERHLSFVDHCARDLNLAPAQREDVIQAGREGLIHAVDRFDPERGIPFVAFARPTITGEMLRYLRDCGSTMRLPRRHRDITHAARASSEHLRRGLGREPQRSDIAEFLGLPLDKVEAAFAAEDACTVLALDPGPSESQCHTPREGCRDRYLDSVPERIDLRRSIAALPEIQRQVIDLHLFQSLPQTQVARRLGMSQVQVSRTLQRAIRRLRELLQD